MIKYIKVVYEFLYSKTKKTKKQHPRGYDVLYRALKLKIINFSHDKFTCTWLINYSGTIILFSIPTQQQFAYQLDRRFAG